MAENEINAEVKEEVKETVEVKEEKKEPKVEEVIFEKDDVSSRKVLAIIGWLLPPVLTIAGLCVDSKYIKFYANQQLWVLLSGIIALVIPVVGWVIGIIGFVFEIIGFIGICTNKAKRMPFLGKIDIIKWDK